MKKNFCVLLFAALTICMSSCSAGTEDNDESSGTASAVSAVSQDSKQESSEPDEPSLLSQTFGTLYTKDRFSIEAEISVSLAASPDEPKNYRISLYADRKDQKVSLMMDTPDGDPLHIIIRDSLSYTLNDSKKSYSCRPYTDSIDTFIAGYTTDMYMGVTEHLMLADTGNENIRPYGSDKDAEAYFEKYKMTPDASASEQQKNAFITYYFIDRQPVLELMSAQNGKTTFSFVKMSDNIEDSAVFDIDPSYTKEDVS